MNRGGGASQRPQGGGGGGQGGKLGDDEYTKGNLVDGPAGVERSIDGRVTAKEDAVVKANGELPLQSLTIWDFSLPPRPDFGTKDKTRKPIILKTNYFKMEVDTDRSIYRYEVTIKKDKTKRYGDKDEDVKDLGGRRATRVAFGLLFENPDFRSLEHAIATDYSKTILTAKKLEFDDDDKKVYRVTYREIEETRPRPLAPVYTFTVAYIGMVSTTELIKYLGSMNPTNFAGRDEIVQALNIIINWTPNSDPGIFQAGLNKFFYYPQHANECLKLTGGLIAVRGYYSSVRTSTMRVLLNVNAQCSPFYPPINMYELMYAHSGFKAQQGEVLERFIEKLRVKTYYLKNADNTADVRVKTIVGLSHKFEDPETKNESRRGNAEGDRCNAAQIKFICEEFPPNPISVQEFFLKKHGIRITKPEAWVLNCGTVSKPVWVPPELCEVMPGQPYRGLLSDVQTSKMLSIAARRPAENARRINGRGQEVVGLKRPNPTLDAFGISIGKDMILVPGRILDPPPIYYKDNKRLTPAGASWNLANTRFAVPGRVTRWSILTLGAAKCTADHISNFSGALRNAGMQVEPPKQPGGNQISYHVELTINDQSNDTSIMNRFRAMYNDKITMLFVILPNSNAYIYGRVKYWGDVKAGIHTVCALENNLNKGRQYFANLSLKMNLKTGGVNQILAAPQLGFLAKDTMVVGIDVTHPAPNSIQDSPSIAGVVSSIDGSFGQWPGSIRCQASRQEIVQELADMMRERLLLWKQKMGKFPEKILVYRDGVSSGQYKALLVSEEDKKTGIKRVSELDSMRKACEICGPRQPKITIIVVGKRHHTRFYPIERTDADTKGNPKNGTIVDRGITMENGHDFFLQAHTCLQGTAKPAHYVIIHDEMKLGADEVQKITHNLCYLYGRATKAVSVAPPAYYADILCERGRCYLQKYLNEHPRNTAFDPNDAPFYRTVADRLKDTMFYI